MHQNAGNCVASTRNSTISRGICPGPPSLFALSLFIACPPPPPPPPVNIRLWLRPWLFTISYIVLFKIKNICEERKTDIRDCTNMAMTAMLVFVIFGTILCLLETVNLLLGMCKKPMMDPVILSVVVCILEELPLAGLRWNLKTSANNQW